MQILAGQSRLIVAAAGIVLAAGYGYAASRLRLPAFSDPMGPRLMPYIIAIGLALASLAVLAEHVVLKARGGTTDVEEGPTRVALVTIGFLVAYYAIFDWLGFILASMLFLIAFLSFTNRGRWVLNIVLAIAFPIAAYLLLSTLLGAQLPSGILPI